MSGCLYVVSTPIGNLEDVTLRALRVLGEADLVAAEDTRRTGRLLLHHGIRKHVVSLHAHNEHARTASLVTRLRSGARIALVTDAGTPLVADPGAGLIQAALEAGIRVEPIPGPSAALAALVKTGTPADRFTFLGFPPHRGAARRLWLDELTAERRPVVFFEAPHRIRQTLGDLGARLGDRPVAICRELTKLHEESVIGPIQSLLEHPSVRHPLGEFTVVIDMTGAEATGRTAPAAGATPALPPDAQLFRECGQMTDRERVSRRAAIGRVARAHGIAPGDVYRAVEREKKRQRSAGTSAERT